MLMTANLEHEEILTHMVAKQSFEPINKQKAQVTARLCILTEQIIIKLFI